MGEQRSILRNVVLPPVEHLSLVEKLVAVHPADMEALPTELAYQNRSVSLVVELQTSA